MSIAVIWILLASTTIGSNGSTFVVDRFLTESQCQDVAGQIYEKSNRASGFKYLRAICVRAEVAVSK